MLIIHGTGPDRRELSSTPRPTKCVAQIWERTIGSISSLTEIQATKEQKVEYTRGVSDGAGGSTCQTSPSHSCFATSFARAPSALGRGPRSQKQQPSAISMPKGGEKLIAEPEHHGKEVPVPFSAHPWHRETLELELRASSPFA